MYYPRLAFFAILTFLVFSSFSFSPQATKVYQVRLAMTFGEMSSDIEAYIFTDWNDPKSKQLEAFFETISQQIMKKGKVYFFDIPSANTKNLTNANLRYLINFKKNIEDYFKFRKLMYEVLTKNSNPTEEEINARIQSAGLKSEIATQEFADEGLKVVQGTIKNLKVTKTPTIILYNVRTRQSKKIEDAGDFTIQKVLADIDSLKTPAQEEDDDEDNNEQ